MRFKNTSENPVNLGPVGLDTVEPGQEVDIPLELAAPGRTDAGARAKSVIECVAPQLKPVSPDDIKLWQAVPPPPEPKSRIVSVAGRATAEPPGVKALREAKAKLEAAKTDKK